MTDTTTPTTTDRKGHATMTRADSPKKQTDVVRHINDTQSAQYEQTCWFGAMSMVGQCTGAWCGPMNYFTVHVGQKGIKLRSGVMREILSAGVHYYNPFTESIVEVNALKVELVDVKTNSNRSKDGINLDLVTQVPYTISDVGMWYVKLGDYRASNKLVAATALRSIRMCIAEHSADEMLAVDGFTTGKIGGDMQQWLDEYGIVLGRVQIVDIDVSPDSKSQLRSTAEIKRQNDNEISKAKTQAEIKAIETKTMKYQIDALGDAFPAILQAQTMKNFAGGTGTNTVVFGGSPGQQAAVTATVAAAPSGVRVGLTKTSPMFYVPNRKKPAAAAAESESDDDDESSATSTTAPAAVAAAETCGFMMKPKVKTGSTIA